MAGREIRAEIIRRHFHLDGETVVRSRTGEPLRQPRDGERMNVGATDGGTNHQFKLYQIKFVLAHGYLPASIDHRDRRVGNDALANLRPASQTEQNWNQGPRTKASGLPKGVTRSRKRFVAQATVHGRAKHLGVFPTPEAAHAAYLAFCKEHRGEFCAKLPEA